MKIPTPYPAKYFDKAFQREADLWWREMSINEWNALFEKYGAIKIAGTYPASTIAAIYDAEVTKRENKKSK